MLPGNPAPHLPLECRKAFGKALRQNVTRSSHAHWQTPPSRPDVLWMLRRMERGRMREFLPIRNARMAVSPFTFFRGTAGIMAYDLAHTPSSGMYVQTCGDAHLMNFGAYASPERRLVFDLNDFDETLRAPWEWDLKRLAASIVLGGRSVGLSDAAAAEATEAMVRAYHRRMAQYADMQHLEVYYDSIDAERAIEDIDHEERGYIERMFAKARTRTRAHARDRLAEQHGGRWRLLEHSPLVTHRHDPQLERGLLELSTRYLESLNEDRRTLLERYSVQDWALRLTGVGSAGKRVLVLLLAADGDDVLFLQVKEANRSVLEPYAGRTIARNPAHRIVRGQRLMQATTDPFLGWAMGRLPFYVRQLRDMKGAIELEGISAAGLLEYAELCGWVLSRAHARSGDAAALSGYLGSSEKFEGALARFALRYADQTERDYDAFARAVRDGVFPAAATVDG